MPRLNCPQLCGYSEEITLKDNEPPKRNIDPLSMTKFCKHLKGRAKITLDENTFACPPLEQTICAISRQGML
jgi:hypothetical protein